ncbi:MAG: acetate/propionate family kinase [Paracoccaceae bacterium]
MSPANSGQILVVNAGSSSIKFAVFNGSLKRVLTGIAAGISGDGRFRIDDAECTARFEDYNSALNHIFDALAKRGIQLENMRAAAHRVVHGGVILSAPAAISPAIRREIAKVVVLAPLHNPANLAAIDAIATRAPNLPQFASFDTGFHATNCPEAKTYALPLEWRNKGLQRYGFHGISFSALVDNHPKPLPDRLLACHLGNGASLCAIKNGKSCATTMGFSPVSGLTMGSRTGDIDAMAVLDIAAAIGVDKTRKLLNHNSGLRALGGTNDMRSLLASPRREAKFTVSHFIHWAVQHAGAMIATLGGLDGVTFTGGIGEHAPEIRAGILDGLEWLGIKYDTELNQRNASMLHTLDSAVQVCIVPADEELRIAQDAATLL